MSIELTALARNIGAQVRHQRTALGITQKELANQAGTSERLIRSLEMGTAYGIGLGKLVNVLTTLNLELIVVDKETEAFGEGLSSVSQGSDYSNMLRKTVSSWSAAARNEVLK